MRRRQYATRREICLRFVDLVSELREFGDGQAAVFVAVEALDEVQGAVLGVMQFVAQYRDRLVERDISLAAETTQTTACCTGLVGRLYCTPCVETIRIPRAEGCGPSDGSNACNRGHITVICRRT